MGDPGSLDTCSTKLYVSSMFEPVFMNVYVAPFSPPATTATGLINEAFMQSRVMFGLGIRGGVHGVPA